MPTPARRLPPVTALDTALQRVGDRWSFLLVDALLGGPRRFGELLAELGGLAPNILSNRLKHLEAHGVVTAQTYSRRPHRVAYALTASGADLAGVLRLLAQWGAESGGPSAAPLHHLTCGTAVEARWWCPTCARVVDDGEAPQLDYV